MKRFLLFIYNLFLVSSLLAQVGHGGQPGLNPGECLNEVVKGIIELEQLPAYVQQQAKQAIRPKGEALRFAHPFFVELTPDNSGEWTTVEDGTRIWRLGIRSQGAYSINLIFDRFILSPGASVYIFDPAQSVVLGAFTHLNNQSSGILATAPIPGDEVVVELHVPPGIDKKSNLMIGAINHDYKNLFFQLKSGDFGDSGTCQVDFTCNDNEIWNEVGRSVCKIIVDGTELCSGTLLNNTRNDGTPYFLTAAHCLKKENSASTVVFYFNYEVPKCEGDIEGFPNQTLSGSSLRAFAETLDFALLEMSSKPPATYRPYWAGWSRTSSPIAPVIAIHHPEGDVKKTAHSIASPIATTFYAVSPLGNYFISNSHWKVASWQSGTTEAGSSGCGLFDSNGQLLGSLSGGSASCSYPVNDYFSRLNKSWNYFPDNDKQLAYWLDSDGVSPESVSGFDYYNGEVERLSNFVDDDVASLIYLNPGKGVWSGHNSLEISSIAEKYSWIKSATIQGIYLETAKSVAQSNKTVNIKIWNGLFEPEELLASKNGLLLSQLSAQRENLVMLDLPVTVEGPLWIEVELNYTATVDSFAVYQSAPLAARIKNTAWLKSSQNEWNEFEDWHESNYPASFWIDILASDVQKVDTSILNPGGNELIIYPNPFCNELNLSLDNDGPALIEVFNMIGQQEYKGTVYIYQGEGSINLSELKQGLYVIKASTNGKVFIRKVMVTSCGN